MNCLPRPSAADHQESNIHSCRREINYLCLLSAGLDLIFETSSMAIVSEGRSKLNPNASPFIPAAVRLQQVEDFSSEWWDLVTTSIWFRDYWLSQHQEEDAFGENADFRESNIVELLPDNIDFGVDEDILNMEAQFEEFLQYSESDSRKKVVEGISENGFTDASDTLGMSFNMTKDKMRKCPREAMRYWEKPSKLVNPKCSPRFIQQPRRAV